MSGILPLLWPRPPRDEAELYDRIRLAEESYHEAVKPWVRHLCNITASDRLVYIRDADGSLHFDGHRRTPENQQLVDQIYDTMHAMRCQIWEAAGLGQFIKQWLPDAPQQPPFPEAPSPNVQG